LTEEQLIVISQLKDEFEHKGVHLSEKNREILHEKFGKLQMLQSQFIHMSNNPAEYGRYGVDKKVLKQMPALARYFPVKNGKVIVDLSSEVVNGILSKVEDEQIRKDVYTAGYQPDARLKVLDQMLAMRQEIAEFLNFPSYSHMNAVHRILKTPQHVMDFLQTVHEKLSPTMNEELDSMRSLKGLYNSVAQGNRDHSGVTSEAVQHLDVNAWDRDYYRGLMKQVKINDPITNIREYFPLGQCWEGLRIISNKLFGIQMNVVQASPSEIWDPSVRKVEVRDEKDSKVLGYLYLDMLSREGKFGGGANFPMRFRSMHSDAARVAVVTNFSPPRSKDKPILLSFSEVETLFHEFGHLLQTLFSTNELQHFSGTRSYNDFVETASTLMENWIWDYNVISLFAKHYKTGEVLPEKALHQIRQSKTMFKAMDTQEQLHLSAVDQYLHSGPVLNGKSSTEVIGQLSQYAPVKFPPGVAPHKYFTHLDSYGAFYYTYLYSTLFSANIWEKCFARDPLNREAGELYRRELLAYGGAKDPLVMVRKLLGGEPSVDVFVNSLKK
jgi:intermediate peptidase